MMLFLEQLDWVEHQLGVQGVVKWKRDAIRAILLIEDHLEPIAELTDDEIRARCHLVTTVTPA